MNKYVACALLLFLPALAQAAPALTERQEAQAKKLFSSLHCVVCGGQSLAGSDARIAQDIRALVRDKIAAGEPDEAITGYLVERYGEGILMEPPVRGSTLPLWLAPAIFLLLSAAVSWRLLFSRDRKAP